MRFILRTRQWRALPIVLAVIAMAAGVCLMHGASFGMEDHSVSAHPCGALFTFALALLLFELHETSEALLEPALSIYSAPLRRSSPPPKPFPLS